MSARSPTSRHAARPLRRRRARSTRCRHGIRYASIAAIGIFVLAAAEALESGDAGRLTSVPAAQAMLRWSVPILLAGLGGLYCRARRRRQHRARGHDDPRHLVRRLGHARVGAVGRHPRSACSAARMGGLAARHRHGDASASTTSSPAWPSTSWRRGWRASSAPRCSTTRPSRPTSPASARSRSRCWRAAFGTRPTCSARSTTGTSSSSPTWPGSCAA